VLLSDQEVIVFLKRDQVGAKVAGCCLAPEAGNRREMSYWSRTRPGLTIKRKGVEQFMRPTAKKEALAADQSKRG
jgi:hypothetical protein